MEFAALRRGQSNFFYCLSVLFTMSTVWVATSTATDHKVCSMPHVCVKRSKRMVDIYRIDTPNHRAVSNGVPI